MSSISQILDGAADLAKDVNDAVTSLWDAIGPGAGWFDDTVDGGLGMVISGVAGGAAALLVAILLSIYFRSGYRSTYDIVKHGFATALVLGLLGLAVYDMRHDVRDYFGLNALPAATGTNLPDTGLLGRRVDPPARPARWTKQLAI